jgi:hypothetical protein
MVPFKVPVGVVGYWRPMGFGCESLLFPGEGRVVDTGWDDGIALVRLKRHEAMRRAWEKFL